MNLANSIEDRKNEIAFKAELDKKVVARQKELEGEWVKDVLIKEVRGGGDRVFIINKLPKDMLYRVGRDMIPIGQQQYLQPSGAVTDDLLPGVEMSQTGDGGYVFFIRNQEGKQRLAVIDEYVRTHWPSNRPLPKREYYAYQGRNPMSPPRPLSMILRVELPVSPPADDKSAASGQPSPTQVSEETKAELKKVIIAEILSEQKEKKAANLEKAREARKKK